MWITKKDIFMLSYKFHLQCEVCKIQLGTDESAKWIQDKRNPKCPNSAVELQEEASHTLCMSVSQTSAASMWSHHKEILYKMTESNNVHCTTCWQEEHWLSSENYKCKTKPFSKHTHISTADNSSTFSLCIWHLTKSMDGEAQIYIK